MKRNNVPISRVQRDHVMKWKVSRIHFCRSKTLSCVIAKIAEFTCNFSLFTFLRKVARDCYLVCQSEKYSCQGSSAGGIQEREMITFVAAVSLSRSVSEDRNAALRLDNLRSTRTRSRNNRAGRPGEINKKGSNIRSPRCNEEVRVRVQMPPTVTSSRSRCFPGLMVSAVESAYRDLRGVSKRWGRSTGRARREATSRNWRARVPLGNGANVIQEFSMNSL